MSKVIEVWHRKDAKFGLVAVVEAENAEIEDALEYAWRWTNNVDGSWSRGEFIETHDRRDPIERNRDFNEKVHVVAPLPEHLGRTYGIRSSMVHDVYVVVGEPNAAYEVAVMGFEKVDWEPVADANRVAA